MRAGCGAVRGWWNHSEACSVLRICGGAFYSGSSWLECWRGASLGGGSGAGSSRRCSSTLTEPGKAPKDDVLIQVRSTGNPHRRFGLEVRCPGNNALPAWGVACRAMAQEPGRLSDSNVDESCVGGVPGTSMRVRGTIAGTPINLRQSGMCGPPGISRLVQAAEAVSGASELAAPVRVT